MPLFDEADIALWSIPHLIRQGIEVYVIDGWSTDGGWEMLPGLGVVGRERLPIEGDDGIWDCTRLLKRVEQLSLYGGSEWCMLNDADEFRYAPACLGTTLLQGIAAADALGCNVIDHRVWSFQPVDDGWTPDKNPEQYFRHYTTDPEIDMVCRFPQEKIFKPDSCVDLTTHGGHFILRPDKRVAPEEFLVKHIPNRTQEQAQRKLSTRLGRRCHREHAKGWGVHYDILTPGTNFLRDPRSLRRWP